jgi:hypothetical protein
MATIEIEDEQLAEKLQRIAKTENRSVESVLCSLVADYPIAHAPKPRNQREEDNGVRRVRAKMFAKARRYWESVGEHDKAALSDKYLDEHFGVFDTEGVPRLKSEMTTLEPPVGSLAYAAKVIREQGGIPLDGEYL